MNARPIAWVALALVFASTGAWLQTPARQGGIAALMPPGATLVLQAKDLSSVVGDWNRSAEKTRWLASGNYRTFSRSRLFLRLSDAYGEFAAAAGIAPNMAFVSDLAGSESALAIYDIGKLEFLYVTRLPQAKSVENALWRTRGSFSPREAAGTPFYVRVNAETKRTVAFAVRDQYLLLATRDDLIAGALTLIGAPGGASVAGEGWFARATGAAGAPGDLRLVSNLEALVKEPHFRSYWVQGNVTELKQYASAVSDLVRTNSEIREERLLLRVQERPPGADAASTLGDVVRLVPDNAGLYRAWASPSAAEATNLIFEKVIATSAASAATNRNAPAAGSAAPVTGNQGDLEARIDEETRAPRPATYERTPLAQLVASEPLTAMLHVEATRDAADRVFLDRGSVIVISRSTDWPSNAAREAIRALVDPVWRKAHLGMRWVDTRIGTQTFSQLEGLEAVAVTERGKFLFLSNDPALLAPVLDGSSKTAVPLPGTYAAGFRHGVEREPFARLMRFVDHASAGGEEREPLFFSENLASLSQTLSRLDSASIVVREQRATVSQTVTYRLGR